MSGSANGKRPRCNERQEIAYRIIAYMKHSDKQTKRMRARLENKGYIFQACKICNFEAPTKEFSNCSRCCTQICCDDCYESQLKEYPHMTAKAVRDSEMLDEHIALCAACTKALCTRCLESVSKETRKRNKKSGLCDSCTEATKIK